MKESYQVLARRCRPQVFDDVMGQDHVLKPIRNSLKRDSYPAAVIFSGGRGLGKTTLARLIGKYLNCEQPDLEKVEPCNTCSPCTSIIDGKFPDFIEIDAATRTQVDHTRQLIENVAYPPIDGKRKIYLIDEVHMLSDSSFNALLKTLEEPPEHVCFIFATTELEKIPKTIISRCLHFQLRHPTDSLITDFLDKILSEEGINFDAGALEQISAAAHGSLRDALTVAEQAIAYSGGQIVAKDVGILLGLVNRDEVQSLLEDVLQGAGAQALGKLDNMLSNNIDPLSFIDSCARTIHRICVDQVVNLDQSSSSKTLLQAPASQLQLLYQAAVVARRDLNFLPDPTMGAEMMVLRMLSFSRVDFSQDSIATTKSSDSSNSNTVQQTNSQAASEKNQAVAQRTQDRPQAPSNRIAKTPSSASSTKQKKSTSGPKRLSPANDVRAQTEPKQTFSSTSEAVVNNHAQKVAPRQLDNPEHSNTAPSASPGGSKVSHHRKMIQQFEDDFEKAGLSQYAKILPQSYRVVSKKSSNSISSDSGSPA